MRGGLLEVGQQRPVRQHRALGPAARAGGVEQDGEVLAAAAARIDLGAGRARRAASCQSPPAPATRTCSRSSQLVGDGGRAPRGRPRARRRRARRCRRGPSAAPARVAGVERDGDQAGAQRAEVGDREVGGVAERQPDAVARRQSEPAQARGGRVDLRVELAPRHRRQRRTAGRACRGGSREAAVRTRLGQAASRRRRSIGTASAGERLSPRARPRDWPRSREDLPGAVVDLRRQRAAVDLVDAVHVLHAAAGAGLRRARSSRRRSPSTPRCRRRGPRASSR